jgi:hypothetical protein
MSMTENKILDVFIRQFIVKDKRERIELQLKNFKNRAKFTNRLNHQWDTILDMRYLSKIPVEANEYEFTKSNLMVKDEQPCYVISNYDDLDAQITNFKKAFDSVYGRGLGSLILIASGDKLYLETEVAQGRQNRFVGSFK